MLRAVRGFCQPGKPGSLGRGESVQVYRKAVKVVLDNEKKAGPAACPTPSFSTGHCEDGLNDDHLSLSPGKCVNMKRMSLS